MNRKITRQQIEAQMQQVRQWMPEVAWRTTFIVGFPTETEEHFEELLAFVDQAEFQHVGVFTYSHEDNIRSSRWGDPIPNAVKRQRRKQLMAAQQQVSARLMSQRVGTTLKVLVDGISEETELLLQGRAEFQGPEVDGLVYINDGQARPGTFHLVEITDAHPYDLVGHIVNASN
jgi:ribosomal protein S12 methylthiotransferase